MKHRADAETTRGLVTCVFPQPLRESLSQPLLAAAGGDACEAACLATKTANDALALATYSGALVTIGNTLQSCVDAAATSSDCLVIGGGGLVVCLPCAALAYAACLSAKRLVCADQADTSRTAALAIYNAALNSNSIAHGACVRACRSANPTGPSAATPTGLQASQGSMLHEDVPLLLQEPASVEGVELQGYQ